MSMGKMPLRAVSIWSVALRDLWTDAIEARSEGAVTDSDGDSGELRSRFGAESFSTVDCLEGAKECTAGVGEHGAPCDAEEDDLSVD